jgi:biotin carboxyl carrier protein
MTREVIFAGNRISFSLDQKSQQVILKVDSREHLLSFEEMDTGKLLLTTPHGQFPARVVRQKDHIFVWLAGRVYDFMVPSTEHGDAEGASGSENEIRAPMPGNLLKLFFSEGDVVQEGQPVVVVEAMKMEHALRAPRNGTIERIHSSVGRIVDNDELIVSLVTES